MLRARTVAEGYIEGHRDGFADACRLAARELPPQCWPVLDALAQRYGPVETRGRAAA
jgi:hypothetical protein